jgi:hypothetical protein
LHTSHWIPNFPTDMNPNVKHICTFTINPIKDIKKEHSFEKVCKHMQVSIYNLHNEFALEQLFSTRTPNASKWCHVVPNNKSWVYINPLVKTMEMHVTLVDMDQFQNFKCLGCWPLTIMFNNTKCGHLNMFFQFLSCKSIEDWLMEHLLL